MFERFFPNENFDTIFDVDYNKLASQGYKGIMFDIDNTLVPYDVAHPSQEIIDLFMNLKKLGFNIALVSNNNNERVYKFNEKLKVFAVPKALKPMTRKLKKAMTLMNTNEENTVFIGDQLFTDIWGGNRLKIKTILVTPIAEKEQWITKIKRGTEKMVFKHYLKKKGINND